MTLWNLRCKVSPGMFDNEFAVCAKYANGRSFSLFVPCDKVRLLGAVAAGGKMADGLLKVEAIEQEAARVLIRLPGQILETPGDAGSGQYATVNATELSEDRARMVRGAS